MQHFNLPLFVLLLIAAGTAYVWTGHSSSPSAASEEASSEAFAPPARHVVNAVLGDTSYIARFGHPPGFDADEDVRIRTHLAYAEQLLRSRPVDHLPPELQAARARHLDRLHEYWTRGIFPRNDGTPGRRRPTFIDEAGRICAVGYLIEQSAGRAVAERINDRYKYAYIEEIDASAFDEWVETSGLTKRELAMIQPMYCGACLPPPDEEENTIRPEVEIGFMALEAGTTALNGIFGLRGRPNYVTSGAGMALGATGLAIGLSDRANHPTTSVVFAGATLLVGTINLTAALGGRHDDPSHAALIPETHVGVVPTRDRRPKMSLSMQWTF